MFNTHVFKKENSNSRAFTIIELLVVIAIIGLISSVVLVSMKGSTGKARIAKGLEFSQTLMNVIGADAVGIWTFDEGSGGTAFDKSGYGNHGTITGATFVKDDENTPHWFVNEGDGRSALEFDGNDWVNCGSDSSLNITDAITIEMWAKLSATNPTWTRIIQRANSDGYGFSCRIVNNKFTFQSKLYDSVYNAQFQDTIGVNRWYHIVGVYDGSNHPVIYINSILGDETVNDNAADGGGNDLNIGRRANQASQFFNGSIDEVRIYARALSSAEIQQHYAAGAKKHQIALK